jgi:hypothetical protein
MESTMALNQSDLVFIRAALSEKESSLRTAIIDQVRIGEGARAQHLIEKLDMFSALREKVGEEIKALEEKVVAVTVAAGTPIPPKPSVTNPVKATFALPTRANQAKPDSVM